MLALTSRRDLDLGPAAVGADYLAGFAHEAGSEVAFSLRAEGTGSNPSGARPTQAQAGQRDMNRQGRQERQGSGMSTLQHRPERVSPPMTGDETPPVVWGTTDLVVWQATGGIPASVACGVMRGIAGRVSRHMTPSATCPAADRIPCETTDEGLRQVTSQTAPQTMCDAAVQTMYDTTPRAIC